MKHEILLSSPYKYSELSRETAEKGRVYVTEKEKLYSVTTILSKTKPENDSLQKWIERVGQEEADRIRDEAAARGTEMHEILERQLKEGSIWDYYPETPEQKRAYKMACTIMDQGFPSIDQVYGCEIHLHYPGKYAGTADVIGKHLGEEAIMDFKQTNTPKRRRQYVWDYFQQLAAYAMAHNELYGTEIKKGVIMMCSVDCFYQEFVLEGREFERAADAWNTRLENFIGLLEQTDSQQQNQD
jgi:genome maintenance exonuclease 1